MISNVNREWQSQIVYFTFRTEIVATEPQMQFFWSFDRLAGRKKV